MALDKLGLHILEGWSGDLGRPRLVKLANCSVEEAKRVRVAVGPQAVLIVRWVEDHLQFLDDPERNARDWYARHEAHISQLAGDPNVAFEGYNEIGDARATAYCAFEVARLKLLHERGLRAVAGNFSVGTPHESLWGTTYKPLLDALASGDFLGLHEYWRDERDLSDTWLCGRWRLMRELDGVPIVVTEAGRDPGWKKAGITPEQYLEELRRYHDEVLAGDERVLGAVVFSTPNCAGGWADFDPTPVWRDVVKSYSGAAWADPSRRARAGQAPQSVWVGSPNFGYPRGAHGRAGRVPIAIVYHVAEGSLAALDKYLQDPKSAVSYHYGIGKRGEKHQYVDEADAAWHAGIVNKPSWPLLEPWNPNLYTVGIALEGHAGEPVTEAAYQALLDVSRHVLARFSIEPSPETLIGHCRIDSVNRANCPGPTFPWPRLFADLASLEERLREAAWNAKGIPYNRDAAFARYAREHGLGNPETPELDVNGYRLQGYSGGIVFARIGDWANTCHIEW